MADLSAYERDFRRAGLPLLIEDYSAREDIFTRAVPLLLIFALVLFVNTEMWQVFSEIPRSFLAWVAGLIVALGLIFLTFRLPAGCARSSARRAPVPPSAAASASTSAS